MRVSVSAPGLDALVADMSAITVGARRDMKAKIREAGQVGKTLAQDNARRTAGRHGKLYPRTFSVDLGGRAAFGGASFTAEYGPVIGRKQGGMEFEFGSRNQPPHLDLAKSADFMGPALEREVDEMVGTWFW